ncbi:MAG: hypothetical protein ACI3XC_00465 [Phascolarctobacterium sp.]
MYEDFSQKMLFRATAVICIILAIFGSCIYLGCRRGYNQGADAELVRIKEQQQAATAQINRAGDELESAASSVNRAGRAIEEGQERARRVQTEIEQLQSIARECRALAEANGRIIAGTEQKISRGTGAAGQD